MVGINSYAQQPITTTNQDTIKSIQKMQRTYKNYPKHKWMSILNNTNWQAVTTQLEQDIILMDNSILKTKQLEAQKELARRSKNYAEQVRVQAIMDAMIEWRDGKRYDIRTLEQSKAKIEYQIVYETPP